MENKPTKLLPATKTAAEVLNQLGLPHTEEHLRIAQVGIDDNAELRSILRAHVLGIKSHFGSFAEKIKALGGTDLASLLTRFIMQERELKRTRPLRNETEYALLDAIEKIPAGPAKTNFLHTHAKAVRRAKTPRPPASARTHKGPSF